MRPIALGLAAALAAGAALVATPDQAHAQFGISFGVGPSYGYDPAYDDDDFGWGPRYQPQNVFPGYPANYGTYAPVGYGYGPSYVASPVVTRRVVVRERYAPRRVVVRQVYQPRRVVVRERYAPRRVVTRGYGPGVVTGPAIRVRNF